MKLKKKYSNKKGNQGESRGKGKKGQKKHRRKNGNQAFVNQEGTKDGRRGGDWEKCRLQGISWTGQIPYYECYHHVCLQCTNKKERGRKRHQKTSVIITGDLFFTLQREGTLQRGISLCLALLHTSLGAADSGPLPGSLPTSLPQFPNVQLMRA